MGIFNVNCNATLRVNISSTTVPNTIVTVILRAWKPYGWMEILSNSEAVIQKVFQNTGNVLSDVSETKQLNNDSVFSNDVISVIVWPSQRNSGIPPCKRLRLKSFQRNNYDATQYGSE